MEIITDLAKINIKNSIVTLGKFDGNHIGHQRLLETAVSLREESSKVVIFTFNIPPAKIIKGQEDNLVRTIQTHPERLVQDYPEGVDFVVEFPFNEETRRMSPDDFVKNVLVDKLDVKTIVVGVDFCFGKDRAGNVDTLKKLGAEYGFRVVPVPKVRYTIKGETESREVSSTLIKQEILKGNMEDVCAMLGRPFSMTDEIVHGKHLGHTIGFPTINFIAPEDKILPPNGVYATTVNFDGRCLPSITNVGTRPTFDDGEFRTVETNIFDFDEDIYGRIVRVDFYKFIRPERRFESAEDLSKEIAANVVEVRDYFRDKTDLQS